MSLRNLRALALAVGLGLGLVGLLFLPVLAQNAAPGRPAAPKGPKGATPTPTAETAGGPALSVPAGAAYVDLTKSSYSARGAHAGETITFTLVAANSGSADALAAEVQAAIPANAGYVAASAHVQGNGVVSVSGKTLSWTGVISAQTAITLTYRATLPGAAGVVVSSTAIIYDPGAVAVQVVSTQLTTQAPTGGPDAFGYTYQDSFAPSSPVAYSWVPTTTPASKLNFGVIQPNNNVTGPVDIGFQFHFYTGVYTQTYINSNGLVMFGAANAGNTDNSPQPIPSPSGSLNFASCLFTDLRARQNAQGVWVERYGSQPNRTVVVTYLIAFNSFSSAPPVLFQMILSEGSDQIKCQYAQTSGSSAATGAPGETGLQNGDGSGGLQYAFTPNPETLVTLIGPLEDGLAIAFSRSPTPRPVYAASSLEASYSVHPGDTPLYTLAVRNNGAANGATTSVDNPIPAGMSFVAASAHVLGGGLLTASGAGIHWTGVVTAGKSVTLTFRLNVPAALGAVFTDTAVISDPQAIAAITLHNPYRMQVLPPTSGGPDSFGYTYKDSFAPTNPVTFSWIVTTSPASKLNFSNVPQPDDELTGPVPLGFNFTFYNHVYTETFINTNGLVMFGSGVTDYQNTPIPDPGGVSNYASCLWMDLYETYPTQGVWVETHGAPGSRYAVITFRTAYFNDDQAPPATFQMILYETSNQIKCQYLSMPGSVLASGGGQGTIGLTNIDGSDGLQYFYTQEWDFPSQPPQAFVGPLEANLAILFKPGPASVASLSASLKAVAPLVHPGEIVTYTVVAANGGNAAAAPVTLDDPIPAGETYVGGSAQVQGGGALSANASAVHWTGAVGAGQSVTVTFRAHLPASGIVTNTATLSGPQVQTVVRSVGTWIQPATGLGVGVPSYGYADSYAPGISYTWVPTTGASHHVTTTLAGNSDNGFIAVPLGFDFPFFDRIYSNTYVSTNGLVMFNGFGSVDNHDNNDPIPTPGTVDNYASCYWTNQTLRNTPASGFWYETQGSGHNHSAIITFVLADQHGSIGDYFYQMILFEDGRVKCQYEDMSASFNGNGRYTTIGLEGRHGDSGVQYFWQPESDNPRPGPVENGLAVQFAPLTHTFLPLINR